MSMLLNNSNMIALYGETATRVMMAIGDVAILTLLAVFASHLVDRYIRRKGA